MQFKYLLPFISIISWGSAYILLLSCLMLHFVYQLLVTHVYLLFGAFLLKAAAGHFAMKILIVAALMLVDLFVNAAVGHDKNGQWACLWLSVWPHKWRIACGILLTIITRLLRNFPDEFRPVGTFSVTLQPPAKDLSLQHELKPMWVWKEQRIAIWLVLNSAANRLVYLALPVQRTLGLVAGYTCMKAEVWPPDLTSKFLNIL